MAQKLTIEVPYPPSLNRMYVPVGRGMLVLSAIGRKYKDTVKRTLDGISPIVGDIRVTAEFYPPNRRIMDIDNHFKALLDALKGVLFGDDKDIVEIHAKRLEIVPRGLAVVTIEEAK